VTTGAHIAFVAADEGAVERWYEVALRHGGTDNGPPGLREQYHPNYYACFVIDPDGYHLEAVCHRPE
jgi:catechol 2,3-dioxygenase-like lactoylglutathione lyase family enzyme